jgi:ribosomal RNA-processing protein 12
MTNLWICSREQLLALRVSNDTPCSRLQRKKSRILSVDARGRRQSKNRQDAARFKTDDGTGKMIIEESDSDAVGVAEQDVAGTAYREALTSVDGFTRGPSGRIKFNKDTKKRRRENAVENEDVEMAETEPARTAGKKRSEVKLGHEFKAKVWIGMPSFLRKY